MCASSAFTRTIASRCHLDNYLRWSPAGVKEGDLIFGLRESRLHEAELNTMGQLEFLRDLGYPLVLERSAQRDQC